jgi:hypothetical protein
MFFSLFVKCDFHICKDLHRFFLRSVIDEKTEQVYLLRQIEPEAMRRNGSEPKRECETANAIGEEPGVERLRDSA